MALLVTLLAVGTAPPASATHGFEIIRTVAGSGNDSSTSSGDGGPAIDAGVAGPFDVAIAADGSFYIVEFFGKLVRKVDTSGIITTVAGGGQSLEDGVLATDALLPQPTGIALDAAGNVYISTQCCDGGQRVRKIDAVTGIITTVAGGGESDQGDGGLATETSLSNPVGLVLDEAGNLFIAEGKRVRRVDAVTGVITTVAGGGEPGVVGDGGPATDAYIDFATDVALDGDGNLYIADTGGNIPGTVRMVDLDTGIITTVAGGGSPANGIGDGGPATEAILVSPYSVAIDSSGSLYISELSGQRVRVVDPSSTITTVAGTGVQGFSGDGGPPAQAQLSEPHGIAVGDTLGLLIADTFNFRIRQVISVPDLLGVTKADAPDPVNVGEEITYTVEVSNRGGSATGATLVDTLPAGVDFVTAEASQGTCSEEVGTVTCDLGTVASDIDATATIVVVPTAPGTIANTVTVSANEDDPFPGNNRATTETRVGTVGCGQVITRNTQLTADLGPCPGDGVVIGKDNVTLDLGGYRVFGFPGPGDGTAVGIRLPNRNRVLIQNGTVSDFDAGIFINSGRSNLVQEMTIRDNVGPDDVFSAQLGDGIAIFDSPFNHILDNVLTGNGVFDGIGVFGQLADGNVIDRNTVEDTIGPASGGAAGQGIIVNGAEAVDSVALITGTRIRDNVVRGNGSAGISNVNNAEARVERNIVEGNGFTNNQGNGIGVQVGIGSPTTLAHVLVKDNQVRGNGFHGIQVTNRAHENRIIDNISTDNGLARGGAGLFHFDLLDSNPNCDSNIWRGNTWGSALYRPECVTTGGSGPPLPPPASSEPSAASAEAEAGEEEFPPFRQAPPF